MLVPIVAEGGWPEASWVRSCRSAEGLIGLAAARGRPILCNEAHLDPRAGHVAGTPIGEPEAIISVPLVARGVVIGAMSLYREGERARFSDFDFELAQRFADAATIAIENARTREELRESGGATSRTGGLLNRRGFNALLAEALEAAPALPSRWCSSTSTTSRASTTGTAMSPATMSWSLWHARSSTRSTVSAPSAGSAETNSP